ncbi:MAG: methionyl-tRNA formyltransferase [Flavobacteriaceae bacterium]|jgi:methionyl-tRNA formyltransferase|nr:methionyl-tRNA formyltransferase [Flavobacteriaceae bacterium]|tara:strand:- start:31512 stop:32459 length:948 start_codon:yes stop_codon:yes gene_type:complete
MRDLLIVFMGTPDFAVGVLKKLLDEEKNIVGVITAPDRPAGRGRKLKPSAVKEFALSKNLPVLQPTNLKDDVFLSELKKLKANLQIVVAFRMLPKVVWSLPEYGTFNLHASLLPQYRGAAPINWAVINQEPKTGVTTFFIDEKIDTGAIILKEEVAISEKETAGTLHDKLMDMGSELVVKTVSKIEADNAVPVPQIKDITVKDAPKLTSDNTRINWNDTVECIDAFIRGLSPYPVAWSMLENGGETLKAKIYSVTKEVASHSEKPGTISTDKKSMKVATKNGYIYIKVIQLPGKRKMDIASLLNGFSFAKDAKLV